MSALDYLIVLLYLVGMVFVGFYFEKKASQGTDSYFLGNRNLPWWALGASGMASNLDVSGTMINVAMLYAFGVSGFFIEIRGGIVLILAFFMIFMGKWNRRSQVMTLAEWMELRFGSGFEGRLARVISAVAILMSSVAIVTYFAIGSGKFIGEFLGIPSFMGISGEFWAALLMIVLTTLYTAASGLYGVVWTDVIQGGLILITIFVISFIAITQVVLPPSFFVSIPMNDGSFKLIETTLEQWTSLLPKWELSLPQESSYSIYNLFGLSILFYIAKVVIEGAGGTGGYMLQRYLAAPSDRDAGLLSVFWTFLLAFRWPFTISIAVIGIYHGVLHNAPIADPERVLPIVINEYVPIGIKGLMVAGLMAAAMSTFSAILNSAAAYWVKDIYQLLINPKATDKQLIKQSRYSTIIVVALGLALTQSIGSINDIWGWLTMGLGSGLIVPLFIRWYWWRLNGYGFAGGILFGMVSAFLQKLIAPQAPEYYAFLIVVGCSLFGTIVVTLLTPPTPMDALIKFYNITRPFGFWGPITKGLEKSQYEVIKKENRLDIISTFIAIPWQLVLFLTLMVVILKRWDYLAILFALLSGLTVFLYFFWFRRLEKR